MSRYRGRRGSLSPLMLLIALVVAIAAVVLIVINLGKDKQPSGDDTTPPATGDTTDPGNTDDPNGGDGDNTPVDPAPTYQRIELNGTLVNIKLIHSFNCIKDPPIETILLSYRRGIQFVNGENNLHTKNMLTNNLKTSNMKV